jgi:predicted dehydrogenase
MLEDTYGHSPVKKMFELGDVYGVGFDKERASRKPVRLAILGAGGVALSKHLPALWRLKTIWEPVELVGVCRRNEEVGKKIAGMYGCRWYREPAAMISAEEPDGVLVLGPDDLHAEHAMACIEAGIPALIEKPITRSLEDSRHLCRTAEERGVTLMTVSNKRYSPPYRRARQYILEGPVSDPALFCGKFNLGYDYVDLFEGGTIHLFDLTRFFMGDVARVSAMGVNRYHRNKWPYPVDNAVIQLAFGSGSVGSLYTSSTAVSLKPWERVEIYGEKSWLAVEDQYELILYDSEEGPAKSWKPVMPNTLLFDEEFGGFMALIENFLQVIRGEELPLVTGWDGHHALELDVASHLSLHRGEAVELPLDPEEADGEYRQWLKAEGS